MAGREVSEVLSSYLFLPRTLKKKAKHLIQTCCSIVITKLCISVFILTVSGAAACVGTAPAADVAAARVGTTLTPTNPNQEQE